MTPTEFILSLDMRDIYILIFLQLLFFYIQYKLVGSRQTGIFDPFTVPLFFTASAWSTVIYLAANGNCSIRLFVMFLLTTLAFYASYILVAPNISNRAAVVSLPINNTTWKNFNTFGITSLGIYLIAMSINLLIFGAGISAENRLEIYSDSGGFGILSRAKDALLTPALFYLIFVSTKNSGLKRLMVSIVILLISIDVILNGSKSGIVTMAMIYITSTIWFSRRGLMAAPNIKWQHVVYFIILVLLIASAVLALQLNIADNSEALSQAASVLLFRIIVASDIFILAYPNNAIDTLALSHAPFLILFNDILNTLRIVKLDIISLGTQLYNNNSAHISISSGGPNAYHNVYGQYLFGVFGAPLFSSALGILYGLIRRGFYSRNIGNGLISGAVFTSLLVNTSSIANDPSYTLVHITNMCIILFPLAFVCSLKFD